MFKNYKNDLTFQVSSFQPVLTPSLTIVIATLIVSWLFITL